MTKPQPTKRKNNIVHVIAAMLLKTPRECGEIVNPSELDEAFKFYFNPWDYPYNQLNTFKTDSLSGTIGSFRNLDDWCFVEHFDQKTLLQVRVVNNVLFF